MFIELIWPQIMDAWFIRGYRGNALIYCYVDTSILNNRRSESKDRPFSSTTPYTSIWYRVYDRYMKKNMYQFLIRCVTTVLWWSPDFFLTVDDFQCYDLTAADDRDWNKNLEHPAQSKMSAILHTFTNNFLARKLCTCIAITLKCIDGVLIDSTGSIKLLAECFNWSGCLRCVKGVIRFVFILHSNWQLRRYFSNPKKGALDKYDLLSHEGYIRR